MSAIAKLTALVSTKSAIGLTVAVLAVGAGGVAAEAAITGSTNPKDWGQQVSAQVEKCKTALAPNTHGIGECVSTFASRNGQAHRANGARDNGADHRASGARGGDHPTGAPTNHPTAPTNHPTAPTNHPTAPPSGPGRKP